MHPDNVIQVCVCLLYFVAFHIVIYFICDDKIFKNKEKQLHSSLSFLQMNSKVVRWLYPSNCTSHSCIRRISERCNVHIHCSYVINVRFDGIHTSWRHTPECKKVKGQCPSPPYLFIYLRHVSGGDVRRQGFVYVWRTPLLLTSWCTLVFDVRRSPT